MDNLKNKLTEIEYKVTQEKGTEERFTGKYYKFDKKGLYSCLICDNKLFNSDKKYDSGSGWPSFYECLDDNSIQEIQDLINKNKFEVQCKVCKSHLGHVFKYKLKPKNYCINSCSLTFNNI